jgi:hypothetical protein
MVAAKPSPCAEVIIAKEWGERYCPQGQVAPAGRWPRHSGLRRATVPKWPTPDPLILTAAFALAALTVEAPAQNSRAFYGSDGRVQSRAYIDSAGTVTVYDAGGRVTGRTHTDSAGTVTVYGAGGKVIGRETTSGTVYDAVGRRARIY